MDKEKQTRTPRNLEAITAGALKLSLHDKVALVKSLKASIDKEVADWNEQAKAANEIASKL